MALENLDVSDEMKQCIDNCFEAVQACEQCADECIKAGDGEMTRCIRLCREAADLALSFAR